MKKNSLFLVCLLIFTTGCKEKISGFDKNVINTAHDNCYLNLSKLITNKSSLIINKKYTSSYELDSDQISDLYRVYGQKIIRNNQMINNYVTDLKTRFRVLGVFFQYEAQSPLGTFKLGEFECSYLYELNLEDTSPKELTLFQITSNKEKITLNVPLRDFSNASNIQLVKFDQLLIKKEVQGFNKNDEVIFHKILMINK